MTYKAILIDPLNRTVSEIEVEDGLQPIYDALSVEGFRPVELFEAARVYGEYLAMDEEGMLVPGLPTFTFAGSRQPIAGRAFIHGVDDEGNSVSTKHSVEQVAANIVWLDLVSTGDIGPGAEVPPPAGFDWAYKGGEAVLKDRDEK